VKSADMHEVFKRLGARNVPFLDERKPFLKFARDDKPLHERAAQAAQNS
jgi:hypothetical protein